MPELSFKELKIIDALRNDPTLTNVGLAELFNNSSKTIENQMASIYKKHGVTAQAGQDSRIKLYVELGWIQPK